MTTREELHRLVDLLPESQLDQAKGFLLGLSAGGPPPGTAQPLIWMGDAPPPTMA